MKKSELIEMAKELESLNRRRRKLEAREKILKVFFKNHIPAGQSVDFDGVLISVKNKPHTTWKTDELKIHLGSELSRFQKKGRKIELHIEKIDEVVEVLPGAKLSPIRGRKGS